ncbi:MAG: cell wall hydrolase [Pseudomonadota bacterium]
MRIARGKAASFSRLIIQPSLLGLLTMSAMVLQTAPISLQDVTELAGQKSEKRWLVHLQEPAGESIAKLKFASASGTGKIDPVITSSISPKIEVSEKILETSLPQRINKAIKGKRVVQTTVKQAPKDFSAGSVLQRQSMMESLNIGKRLARVFVKPKPHQEAIQIASAFHLNKPKIDPTIDQLPVMVASLVEQSRDSILSYAPEPQVEHSPFAAVLREDQQLKILPKLNKGDHSWADDVLPKNSFSKRQQKCLAEGIYFEARGEPVRGQAAVSQVILNRVRNPHYPDTICGVVYQNKHWHNRCQFSFACDRIRDRILNKRLYGVALHVAAETTANRIWLPQVGSSTHYHATYVNPRWARTMKRVGKIGLHIFYRTYGGGWS